MLNPAKLLFLTLLAGCASESPESSDAPPTPGIQHLFDLKPSVAEVSGSFVSEAVDRELRSGNVWIRGEQPARGDWEFDRSHVSADGPLLLRAPTRFEVTGPRRLLKWAEADRREAGRVLGEDEEVVPEIGTDVIVSSRGIEARIKELGRFPSSRPISYPTEASQVLMQSVGVPPSYARVAEPSRTVFGRTSRRTAIAPVPTELSWNLLVPELGQVNFVYGLRSSLVEAAPDGGLKVFEKPPERPDESGAVRFRVLVRSPGQEVANELWSDVLTADSRDHFFSGKAHLKALEGTTVEVAFLTESAEGQPIPESLIPFWGEPIVDAPQQGGPPSVVLLVCDTLRADGLGCYGNPRDVSPTIDQLARDGVRYAEPMAEATWTLPSHASIMTSLHASQHGVLYRERIPEEAETLAEVMRAGGYLTMAVTEGIFVTPRFGMDHGFDHFESCPWDIEQTFDRAIRRIRRVKGRFFLYLHTFQAHAPYASTQELRDRLVDPYEGPLQIPVTSTQYEKLIGDLSPEDIRFIRQLYDAEIALIDQQVGVLLEALKETGRLDNTLIILTSDHGEAFDEHGTWGHGTSVYQEQLKVPLIVYQRGRFEGGLVPEHPVHTIDVAPTVVRAAGLEAPESWAGIELEVEAAAAGRELVGSFLVPPWQRRATILRLGSLKVMQFPQDENRREDLAGGPPPVRAYDLAVDPGEEVDIWDEVRGDLGIDDLEGIWDRYPGMFEMGRSRIDDALQGQLEALGYAGDD